MASPVCLKLVVLGNAGVGKTALLDCFVNGSYKGNYRATIGSDLLLKRLVIDKGNRDQEEVSLQLWDTAGQERFRSLNRAYFRGADGCVLVFDLNSIDSFTSLSAWRDEFAAQCGCGPGSSADEKLPPILVIGNKADLVANGYRCVATGVPEEWCRNTAAHYEVRYSECSARSGDNVETAFQDLAAASLAWKRGLSGDKNGVYSDLTVKLGARLSSNSGASERASCACR